MECDVAVVGCGVVGLSAALALQDRGVDVVCIDRGLPGGEQSRGLTRIFRTGHEDRELTELAVEAKTLWRVWEQRFARRLLGDEGLLGFGETALTKRAPSLAAAGVEHRILTSDEWRSLMPLYRSDQPALYEPGAGAIRARRTIDCLAGGLTRAPLHAEVTEISVHEHGAIVAGAHGVVCRARSVLICCGNDTPSLARDVDIDIPVELNLHTRFTLQMETPVPPRVTALMDDAGYGAGVGSTDRYAIGVGLHALNGGVPAITDPQEWSRATWERLEDRLKTHWPGLRREPVDEVRCRFPTGEWMVGGSEGFVAWRNGTVTAMCGGNLFKFAPLIGSLLARAVLDEAVPDALRPRTR